MHVNTTVTLARDRARDVVTNSQRPKTFAPTFPECPECICSFAALADGKNQSPRRHRRVAMAKLARIFDFGGNIRQTIVLIFPYPAGMVIGGATCAGYAPQ